MRKTKQRKNQFWLFAGIISWWRRRSFFYMIPDETMDEESLQDEGGEGFPLLNRDRTAPIVTPQSTRSLSGLAVASYQPYPFERNCTKDSFQGSLESMDSLVESYWDPEDETSQATAMISNAFQSKDFFVEHVGFLSVQAQPREVELIYNT